MSHPREAERAAELLTAQRHAAELFAAVEDAGILRPGVTESRINQEVYDLAEKLFGVKTYWHKRIVRAGENTLLPYAENPPDLTVGEDEIVFLDLGPVFEAWEADFGRTFVLGGDSAKLKIRDDCAAAFASGKRYFEETPGVTAAGMFQHVTGLARQAGWEFGGIIAGHLIGQFPHERIPEDKISLYIHPRNPLDLRARDAQGGVRHWILEIHLVDRVRKIGAFFEELLTI